MTERLTPWYIEHIHDVLVGVFLPFDEKVNPSEYRSRALIESAAERPFQTCLGNDLWPTLPQKAAALFHSLACNHCFINGNKRTAVIALDLFLTMNDHIFTMTPDQVYLLAKATAKANEDGRSTDAVMVDLAEKIAATAIHVNELNHPDVQEKLGEDFNKFISVLTRHLDFNNKVIGVSEESTRARRNNANAERER